MSSSGVKGENFQSQRKSLSLSPVTLRTTNSFHFLSPRFAKQWRENKSHFATQNLRVRLTCQKSFHYEPPCNENAGQQAEFRSTLLQQKFSCEWLGLSQVQHSLSVVDPTSVVKRFDHRERYMFSECALLMGANTRSPSCVASQR